MARPSYPNTIIQVAPDVYDELHRLTQMTRRPIGEITTEALRYALENSRMVEVVAYDVAFGECKGKGKKE